MEKKTRRRFDLEKQQRLCAMVSVGTSVRRAAELCEVGEAAVRARQRRDAGFRAQIEQALQLRELTPLRHIREACGKNWRAAAWMLERIKPAEYARRKADSWQPHEVAATMRSFAEMMIEVLRREVADRDERVRVAKEFTAICRRVEAIQQSGPDLRPGRLPKPARRERRRNTTEPPRKQLIDERAQSSARRKGDKR
ncbi:MAG: hypothetical protein JNK76_16170 [Planctomycetales bacterium]|nr:hypothetical protein [Planctomycetales bacterium]MBN8627398.1 hypothetical protein [Planctomycetota bacterium]